MIAQYTTTLAQKNIIAQNTYQLLITKPKNFSFAPGQYMFLDFPNPTHTDDCPSFRAMSIASSPHEEYLMFVMRGSESAFKKNMIAMKEGDEMIIKGPMGHVMLPSNSTQAITFLVAGVGITPARAMIKYEEHAKSEREITLLYTSRTKDFIAFYDEFKNVQLVNYHAVFTLTRETGEWEGEKGRIDSKLVEKYVDDIQNTMYYIVGTQVFVESMKELLEERGVAKENMQFDNFG